MLPIHQLKNCIQGLADEQALVLVSIAQVRGSAPREVGASMIVTRQETYGTIGGGQLEYACQRIARAQANDAGADLLQSRNFPLGSSCGQCCGGVVDVVFEKMSREKSSWLTKLAGLSPGAALRLTTLQPELAAHLITKEHSEYAALEQLCGTSAARYVGAADRSFLIERLAPSRPCVGVFGAGHVGRALTHQLEQLDWQVFLVDQRAEAFGNLGTTTPLRERVLTPQPALFARHLPATSAALVMTHSHDLDFKICCALLKRTDLKFVGLIGSSAKRARFLRRFAEAGLSAAEIDRLTCPIGIDGINGKTPAEIAIAVSAQLLQLETQLAQSQSDNSHESQETADAALSD